VPATAIIRGPFFKVLQKHQCEISFSIEAEDGAEKIIALVFEDVEAFKCTYLSALGSIDHELFKQSYANLISLEISPWLTEIKMARKNNPTKTLVQQGEAQHLMISFDDGPCYEIICESFKLI